MNDVFKFQLVPGKPRRIFYDNNITDDECRPILYKKNRGVRFAALNPHTLAEIMADVRKDWRAARTRKYAQSEHGRETKQIWNQSPEGKAAKASWSQSPKGKAAKLAWNQSPEGKAAKLTWNQSPKGKAARAALQRSPEAKAARATWRKTDIGQAHHQRTLASHRAKSLDRYLNRQLAEKRFRGLDEAGKPIIPPHACPWYASAITAHTRRELMKIALIEPECVIGFATDAIYLRALVGGIPRLKSDADIAAGKTEKQLGDWCWSKVPAAVFIQSGLALYLDKNGKVMPEGVKCRGLPIKKLDKAQKFLDNVLKALDAPHDPKSINCFGHKTKPPGRHASVEIRAFMPLHSAIVSPKKFNDLFCKWGDVTKTIWLDDCGGKRTIDEGDLDDLRHIAIQTSPSENPTPDKLSTMKCPDWVENKIREKGRQTTAINQYYKIDAADVINPYDDYEDDGEFGADNELDNLLEANEDIEV